MAPDNGVEALRAYQTELSRTKQLDVLRAIQDLGGDPSRMTIAGVSRAAGVSREFIHSHRHLHSAVQQAAEQARSSRVSPTLSDHGGNAHGLRADLVTLLDRVEQQRTKISELQARLKDFEEQRRRWLGSQLSSANAVDPEVHAELHLTNERLTSERDVHKRKVAELRQLLDVARADLAASREGWAQDIARFTKEDPQVVLLDRARGKQK